MKLGQGVFALTFSVLLVGETDAHGAMTKPASRNWRASQDIQGRGSWSCPGSSFPKVDYNWQSLNENESPYGNGVATSVCGITQRDTGEIFDYDHPKNCNGGDLTWASQESYSPGQEFEVEIIITAHHEGFFEFFVCGDTASPTKACFDSYPLTFVSDPLYNAPVDSSHPTRAYIPPATMYDGRTHRYKVRMPNNAPIGNVLLQWRYTTGNTCEPEAGYLSNYNGMFTANSRYGSLSPCGVNYAFESLPETRVDNQKVPERFWNCAEVSVGGTPTGSTPTAPQPSPTPAPQSSPTPAPQPLPTPAPQPLPTDSPNGGNSGSCACSAGESGMKAANGCSGYVWCVHGTEYGFQPCPAGTKFQEGLQYCDWEANVSCPSSCTPSRRRNLRSGNNGVESDTGKDDK